MNPSLIRPAGFFALALGLLAAAGPLRAEPIEVQVQVSGLRSTQGRVLLAAHATREGFPSQWDKATARLDAAAAAPAILFTLRLPAAGRYALIAVHDEDGDGRMSKNLIGLPREGYVTGDNPGSLQFPRFERARVELQQGSRVELRLLYP